MTKLHRFLAGHVLELDEALFFVILVAFLLLLGLIIGFVGDMASFRVTVFANDLVIIFRLLDHHHFVNAPFTGCRNGANIKGHFITRSLSGVSCILERKNPNSVNNSFNKTLKNPLSVPRVIY
jgi:hypothetical protein